MWHYVRIRLDLVEKTELFETRHDRLARGEAIQAVEFFSQNQRASRKAAQKILVVG